MITIVDTGLGNLGSLRNMFRRIGQPVELTADHDRIRAASRLVLPGVGAFDTGMRRLHELGLVDLLARKALDERVPVLGVCLGMQLMTSSSEEGALPGLGWFDAATRRLRPPDPAHKVPHMGWNRVKAAATAQLFHKMDAEARYYFVHSYFVECSDVGDVAGWTTHGVEFASALQRANLLATQFHPEKSHRFGMALLGAFAAVD